MAPVDSHDSPPPAGTAAGSTDLAPVEYYERLAADDDRSRFANSYGRWVRPVDTLLGVSPLKPLASHNLYLLQRQ
jgi:hypothetical protein